MTVGFLSKYLSSKSVIVNIFYFLFHVSASTMHFLLDISMIKNTLVPKLRSSIKIKKSLDFFFKTHPTSTALRSDFNTQPKIESLRVSGG